MGWFSSAGHREAPLDTERLPPGLPHIIANEAAERFSFYGMRTLLTVFMTKFLLDATGEPAPMDDVSAREVYHNFVAACYFFPLLGAFIADAWWGKYRTIMTLSFAYCLGHLVLGLNETRNGLFWGLGLIAIGAGGIKPCVSAHVGDQFGDRNRRFLEPVFGWFYFSINLGAVVSTLLTPWLLRDFPTWLKDNTSLVEGWSDEALRRLGPHVAFGVPGLLMLLATLVFWMGRSQFAHVPPRGLRAVLSSFEGAGGRALLRLIPVYLCIAVFWSLYDQTGSAWVLQAEQLDRVVFGYEIHAEQVQAANPFLILLFVPLFSNVLYPLAGRFVTLTPLRKITSGMVMTAAAFALSGLVQQWIEAGQRVSVWWQIAAFVVITLAEVMVSVTGLEFSYTQAPKEMKSMIMSVFLSSVFIGNLLTSQVNAAMAANPDIKSALAGPAYYWFFAGLMLVTSVLMGLYARSYRGETYLQHATAEKAAAG